MPLRCEREQSSGGHGKRSTRQAPIPARSTAARRPMSIWPSFWPEAGSLPSRRGTRSRSPLNYITTGRCWRSMFGHCVRNPGGISPARSKSPTPQQPCQAPVVNAKSCTNLRTCSPRTLRLRKIARPSAMLRMMANMRPISKCRTRMNEAVFTKVLSGISCTTLREWHHLSHTLIPPPAK